MGVPGHLSPHGSVCSLPVHGCGAPGRDSTCVGDCRSPRGDLATGPVHSPFISLSVRVNTRVSGFATSLITVGPVTTPSDRLRRCCDLSPGRRKKPCAILVLWVSLSHSRLVCSGDNRSPPRALTTALEVSPVHLPVNPLIIMRPVNHSECFTRKRWLDLSTAHFVSVLLPDVPVTSESRV